jgi:hypothetical protein
MSFLTKKQLSRRTVLKGMGVTMALPFLDAMAPARASAAAAGKKIRFVAVEMVHGSAGSSQIGIKKNLWAPAGVGRDFDLSPTSLSSLEPFRDHLTIVSNCDVRNAEAFTAPEIGGDHFRSSAVFLTQMHPKQTQGSDVKVGTSLDQQFAQRFGQDTPIPSMQLCIENVDQAGGCSYGYSCTYTDSNQLGRFGQSQRTGQAASDGPRPARRVRSTVRRRRDAGRAPRAACRRPQHSRLAVGLGGAPAARTRHRRPRAHERLP